MPEAFNTSIKFAWEEINKLRICEEHEDAISWGLALSGCYSIAVLGMLLGLLIGKGLVQASVG